MSLTTSHLIKEKENDPRLLSKTAETYRGRQNGGITDNRQMLANKQQLESVNTNRSPNESRNGLNKQDDHPIDYVTPKRKRKFPGPAGVLPKLVSI